MRLKALGGVRARVEESKKEKKEACVILSASLQLDRPV